MTNQKEQNKRKNQISLIMAILGLIVCIIVIIWLFFPGGGNDSPTPTPDPPQPDAVARDYWTIEFMFSAAEFENIYLKKVSVNDEGKIARVESFHPTDYTVREEFVYKNGRRKLCGFSRRQSRPDRSGRCGDCPS